MLVNEQNVMLPVIAGSIFSVLLVLFVIYFIVLYRKKQVEFEWEREQFKQQLLITENEIKEQTLKNVARELHDNLGQVASLLKINLGLIKFENQENDLQKINDSKGIVQQMILDIKALSSSLNGRKLQVNGLANTLKEDFERVNHLGHLDVELIGDDKLPKLNAEIQVFLYRIFQEITNNILQHSQATSAKLIIDSDEEFTIFEFVDNGIGFDASTNVEGNGMSNIRDRCKIIKAELIVDSKPDQGTSFKIKIKNNANREAEN